jgi:hypothetical protein
MDPNDLDLYVICETTGQLVLACHCGPHEACPEHLLNCLMNIEEDNDGQINEWFRKYR